MKADPTVKADASLNADASRKVDASLKADAAVNRQVKIRLVIGPDTARPTVRFRDKDYTGSPFVSPPVEVSTTAVKLWITAPGFETHVLTVLPDKDVSREITLKRRTSARRPRPMRRRPMRKPMLIGLD